MSKNNYVLIAGVRRAKPRPQHVLIAAMHAAARARVVGAPLPPEPAMPVVPLRSSKAELKALRRAQNEARATANRAARPPAPTRDPIIVEGIKAARRRVVSDKLAVKERDGMKCMYCLVPGAPESLSVDHLVPSFHGGSDNARNLVASCFPCNVAKGSRLLAALTLDETGRRPRFIDWPMIRAEVAQLRELHELLARDEWSPYPFE